MTTCNPLKWHGGKTYLASKIISLMPQHTHYVEPYFGGGAVLFAKDPTGVSEVVNDVNYDLTNFWSVMREEALFLRFKYQVENTPMSEVEFNRSMDPRSNVRLKPHGEDVHAAVRFFIRYRQSRQGLGKDFATLSRNRTRRGMNEQASSWLSAIEGLDEARDRLKSVVILCRDALDVISTQDGPHTLFYLDPPYLHSTRSARQCYEHEMSADDHERLLACLSNAHGKFMLSGYPSPLYDRYAFKNSWRRVDIDIDNKSSSSQVKEIKTECLWMNY